MFSSVLSPYIISFLVKYKNELGILAIIGLILIYIFSLKNEIDDLRIKIIEIQKTVIVYKNENKIANNTILNLLDINKNTELSIANLKIDYDKKIFLCNSKEAVLRQKEKNILKLLDECYIFKRQKKPPNIYTLKECSVKITDSNSSTSQLFKIINNIGVIE